MSANAYKEGSTPLSLNQFQPQHWWLPSCTVISTPVQPDTVRQVRLEGGWDREGGGDSRERGGDREVGRKWGEGGGGDSRDREGRQWGDSGGGGDSRDREGRQRGEGARHRYINSPAMIVCIQHAVVYL